jgi:hypothetical protein
MKNPEFQKHQNKSEIIDGHQYSGHALDQIRNRGIPMSVVKDTLRTGTKIPSRNETSIFYNATEKIQVVVDNKTKNIITVKFGEI